MGYMDIVNEITTALWGNGSGRGLGFDYTLVAKSAAYNKMGSYARNVISTGLSANVITKEQADAWRKALKEGDDEIFDKINSTAAEMASSDNDVVRKIGEQYGENIGKYPVSTKDKPATVAQYAEFLGKDANEGIGFKNVMSGYFMDAKYGETRVKAAATAGAGVAIGGRLLSGGTLTRTNTGERDIAGIPFI